MALRPKSFPELEDDQARAAEPAAHAALSASAGTGKTQVLTARVLRLLLSGVEPETILCLTFTKAGAAEMANRIGARLASWVRMKDGELKTDIVNLGETVTPPLVQRARRLFAKVLEAPGGLRIQTIHSFAQTLLAAFPAEAGITPGFEPLEGRAEQELARSTLAALLADSEQNGDSQLLADVQCLSLRLGEQPAVSYLMECARAGDAIAAFGERQEIERALRAMMGLPEGGPDDYLAEHCADDRFDCELLRAIASANRTWAGKQGIGHADVIDRWLALDPAARVSAVPELRKVVLTEKGTLRVSAGQRRADAAYDSHAEKLAGLVAELLRIQNGARLASDMAAGLRAGSAFAGAYARAKRSAGVADFNDLIVWTRELLAKPGIGEWVRYKLDRRIDHILVDEAQDTNASQWAIVDSLAAEYFSGFSEAGQRTRTLFMVGDFKQAIYGFQGTDPREFERMRQTVRERAAALREAEDEAGDGRQQALEFRDLSIDSSFRSAPAILETVDAVIGEVGFRGMGLPELPNPHRAHYDRRPGIVELWAPFAPEEDDEGGEGEEGWLDQGDRDYAHKLAEQVRAWLDEAPVLDSTKRPLTAGDILVLVRSRGELASLLVARLFSARVPVAGIDRLHLSKPFAVRDLLAAVAFAVQPLDDLNLANLLVSPLVGWNQDQLFELAFDRKRPLWRVLRDRAGEQPHHVAAVELLRSLLAMADYAPPSRFLETILSGPMDGRRKLYARLGPASRDPIDELLSSALEFERNQVASLDRFIAWFARGEVEIQRDPSAPANAVRVMTVHGAKGLEAPFVILADATSDPSKLGNRNAPIEWPTDSGPVPLIRPRKEERVEPWARLMACQQERDLEEHWRLLYVGLTRASERLVVAGRKPAGERVEDCWHVRVERALMSLGAVPEVDERWGQVLRHRGSVEPRPTQPKPARQPLALPPVPGWASCPAPPEARPPRPLAPSALAEDRDSAPPPSAAMRATAERGTLIHALLERLPPVAPEQRRAAALRWLEGSAGVLDPGLREDLAGLVCGLLGDDRFAGLFGPNSLAEAPIAATLADGRVIAGTVDRLLVEDRRVVVVDYKTGRAPEREADIPPYHRAQMRAYADALAVIFPGRTVEAALLYISSATLFELAG